MMGVASLLLYTVYDAVYCSGRVTMQPRLPHHVAPPPVASHVAAVKALEPSELTVRERAHVRALLQYASGNLPGAVDEWSGILTEHPFGASLSLFLFPSLSLTEASLSCQPGYHLILYADILALPLLYRACVWLGRFEQQRDTISRLLPFWTKDMQLYPFLMAL